MAFRPAYRIGDLGTWRKLKDPAEIIQVSAKELEAHFIFDFDFDNKITPVYFAMSFPYTYEDLQMSLDVADDRMKDQKLIYYRRDLLIKSVEGRRIDLLTISSFNQDSGSCEERVHDSLFPETRADRLTCKR